VLLLALTEQKAKEKTKQNAKQQTKKQANSELDTSAGLGSKSVKDARASGDQTSDNVNPGENND
jgi:hypothetical protein